MKCDTKVDSSNDYSANAEFVDCHENPCGFSRNDKGAFTLESTFYKNALSLSLRDTAPAVAWQSKRSAASLVIHKTKTLESTF